MDSMGNPGEQRETPVPAAQGDAKHTPRSPGIFL